MHHLNRPLLRIRRDHQNTLHGVEGDPHTGPRPWCHTVLHPSATDVTETKPSPPSSAHREQSPYQPISGNTIEKLLHHTSAIQQTAGKERKRRRTSNNNRGTKNKRAQSKRRQRRGRRKRADTHNEQTETEKFPLAIR